MEVHPVTRFQLALCSLFAAALLVPAASADYKAEGAARVKALEGKFVGLAEAMPQSAYSWRPMDGVRSVSELFLHVAGANYRLVGMLGGKPPEGMSFDGWETSTADKAAIVAKLKDSFAHLQKVIAAIDPSKADQPMKVFGQDSTNRGALWTITEHLSEHLGQGIAYARSNKVVPPWTAARGGD
jgi:uncharacterized damage-inducible protein DinB